MIEMKGVSTCSAFPLRCILSPRELIAGHCPGLTYNSLASSEELDFNIDK